MVREKKWLRSYRKSGKRETFNNVELTADA